MASDFLERLLAMLFGYITDSLSVFVILKKYWPVEAFKSPTNLFKHYHCDFFMTPKSRRVLQAILYEIIAIAFVAPVLSIIFDEPPTSSIGLAFVLSSIALGWNYVLNTIFERWEARQSVRGRSFARRLMHGISFEGGLVVILVPVMAVWLNTSVLNALLTNLGLLAFFFVYAIAFTWAFDRVFGLPESAVKNDGAQVVVSADTQVIIGDHG